MAQESFADLVRELKELGAGIVAGDTKTNARIDVLQKALDVLTIRMNRPGAEGANDNDLERKDAVGLCRIRRSLTTPKIEAGLTDDYSPAASEVDAALIFRKALKNLWRHGNIERLGAEERKSLSSFSFGSSDFLLPPTLATQVISCITDPTDLAGLVNSVNISGPSLKFLIDNARISIAAWACEASCFANNPQPDLQAGLGEMEIKPESLRFVVCVTNDLLSDAAFNLESYILRKVSDAFRVSISDSIVAGDGLGKPMGFLNPGAGVPILDTSPSTPDNQFTWQDLVQLRWDVPVQWHSEGRYFLNQRTWALITTMSDGIGRPLWSQLPGGEPGFQLNGSPVTIVTQFPDVAPGATPVMFGNLRQAYTMCVRQATTMRPDPFTGGGFCTIFRFEARVGGNLTCPNALRLLRIR